MARRGVFGRLPRAAPDLTNTIVSLVREANAMEDSNYVDAWKNGGKVDGKGVDDDRLLEHLKMRRDQLSPDDPAWDQWNNRVAQYDFSINESKISLKFDQGKVSEQAVANFYGKWAGRSDIQQDSEFYRHLLSQQAKWHEAAKQGRASGGRNNAYEAHNKWVEGVLKDKVKPASDAAGYILQIAKIYQAAPDSASSLADVYENTKGWGSVLDIIDDGVSDNPIIQGKIDQATELIRQTMGKDWKWNKANIDALFDMADDGNKSLIRNSMSDTERKQWRKQRAEIGYEGTRVANTAASARIAKAADNWADDLDDCKGDAYCAKAVTKTYRDTLVRESKTLVGDVKLGDEDTEQAGMLATTIGQLDDVIAGRKVDVGRSPAVDLAGGTSREGEDLTQIDIGAGQTQPGGFIGLMGNMWNDDIKKLNAGGWVSSEPVLRQDGSQQVDGEGNPQFQLVTHPVTEAPMPGLVPVHGVLTMDTGDVDIHAPGGPRTRSIAPVQWVTAAPASIVTVDQGGRVVTPDQGVVGRVMKGGKPDPNTPDQTVPSAGYEILQGVTGPDGTARTMYRTGDGAKVPFMYHTEPPVPLGTKTQLDPKTGAKVPVLTAIPIAGVDKDGKATTTLAYDPSIFADGITKARTQLPSGNFVLGTYRTVGAASAAQSINSIFAKGGGRPSLDAVTEATKYLNQFKTNIDKLPANDPARLQSNLDYGQLQQTVSLHAGQKFGKTIDDAYGALNDRTAGQQRYEDQLAARGISTARGYTEDEVSRRISVLEQIDAAEGRLERMPTTLGRGLGPGAGAYGNIIRGRQQDELDAILRAKQDVANPLISVSGIKVPGFAPQMQSTTFGPANVTGGPTVTGGPGMMGGPVVTGGPQVGIKKQVPFAAPGPIIKNGSPVKYGPTTAAAAAATIASGPKPLANLPGKQKDDLIVPPVTIKPLPKLSAAAELRRQEEERNRHGALEF